MKSIKVRGRVLDLHFRNIPYVVPPKAYPWSVALQAWGIGHGAWGDRAGRRQQTVNGGRLEEPLRFCALSL
jgi:hypothetical protein